MAKNVLIIEDDNDINDIISEVLTKNDFICKKVYSGTEALIYLKDDFDLFILDLMLPGLAGEKVIEEIRKVTNAPVLVLSSKDSMDSKLALLRGGADDYMTKPFNLEELLARANILTKRSEHTGQNLTYKSLRLNTDNYQAYVDDMPLVLTKTEFKILELLISNPKQVFTKENLYEYSQGDYYLATDNSINVHISNLRKKIKKYSKEDYIETVWGIGFKLI
ncbi:response regulator transcription factor [Anaerococcus provencensis]|uniref:response regulator transcription factor n=1 Tax=Anaerococcus provencensis TaxID=938293 RepID=UPI0002DB168F|nr:response regulator transcription factor [Anaerococcus provencensis]